LVYCSHTDNAVPFSENVRNQRIEEDLRSVFFGGIDISKAERPAVHTTIWDYNGLTNLRGKSRFFFKSLRAGDYLHGNAYAVTGFN
jgi:hypothetical protein